MSEILNLRDLGSSLRKERRARKLTQQQLADLASMTRQTIINVENGEDAGIFTIMRMMRAMDCCFEIRPIVPDYTRLGEMLDEA